MKKAFFLGLLISGSLVSVAQEQKMSIPMTAKNPEGFAPDGWKIEVVERGDLNGDKIDDAAIVMTKPEVKENDAIEKREKRFLALAFGDGGRFERTAFSDKAVLDTDEGGIFGDPFEGIKIENGTVVIMHYGGSAWRWSYTHRYRWQQNRLMLIGRTEVNYHIAEPDKLNEIDTNLSTGLVHCTDTNIFEQEGKNKPPKKGDYYELQAVGISQAQKIDGLIEAGEWQGYVLKLNAKRQVISGIQLWKGISDVSATLNAVRQGEDLFIRAEVTDDQFSDGDLLRLVDKRGRAIAPEEIKTAPAPKGYNVEARYSMRGLAKLAPLYEGLGDGSEILLDEDDVRFSAAVEVIDVDGEAKGAALSTKLQGSPFNGSIRAYWEGIAVLENK
jgi:hypothetical protein